MQIDKLPNAIILFIILLLLLTAAVFLAPPEKELGIGIRYVYVHVALMLCGTIGFVMQGILGLIISIGKKHNLYKWVVPVGLVSILLYAISIVVSMVAAKIYWGSISWREPYMVMSIQVMLAASIVQVSYSILPWLKVKGIVSIIPIVFLLWLTRVTKLVLHPESPIRDSASSTIKLSFTAIFIPCLLLSIFTVLYVAKRYKFKLNE